MNLEFFQLLIHGIGILFYYSIMQQLVFAYSTLSMGHLPYFKMFIFGNTVTILERRAEVDSTPQSTLNGPL